MNRKLFLIGYRGSGKSTVGRVLADRMGWSFVDTDQVIEERSGKSIREIFHDDGEAAFRDLESGILAVLRGNAGAVVATGGGIVLREENRRILREDGFVVWLTADAATLWTRIERDASTAERRPALTTGGLDEVRQLLAIREPLYRQVRGLRVVQCQLVAGTGRGRYPGRMEIPLAEIVWVVFAFLIGVNVGSFLNVVVGRLPLEKSILWPNSRCMSCLTSLSGWDNLPIVGWLVRRGRCRYCGSRFSSRYMWIELITGIGFAVLFVVDFLVDWHSKDIPFMKLARSQINATGLPPWEVVPFFVHHAVLFSLLLAAAMCDWDHKSIPLSLTVTGTIYGLISATCFPWPWPNDPSLVADLNKPLETLTGEFRPKNWSFDRVGDIMQGLYPWPVWGPVPSWLAHHRWALGLLTGVTGAAAGMFMIRAVKFTFEKGLGKEALGLGDADLMMMSGAFLGWQPVVVAFFIGAIVSLPVGVAFRLVKKEEAFPFGPGLALGIIITMLTWRWLAPVLQMYLFEPILVLVAVVVMAAGLFFGSIIVCALGSR